MDRQFIYNFVNNLQEVSDFVSGEVLCKKMNISSRTLRNKIKENERYFHDYGFQIVSKTKLGYLLKIEDDNKYNSFKDSLFMGNSIPMNKEERISFLLKELLTKDDYIKLVDLEENLYVSKYTLTSDIKELKDKIEKFNLDIEVRSHYGIKIKGNEINKRSCLSHMVGNTDLSINVFQKKYTDKLLVIEKIVKEKLNEYQFTLTDIGFKNLILHIFLGMSRVNMQNIHSGLEIDRNQVEYSIAVDIYNEINKKFHISLPEIEIDYIAIHLLSKQLLDSKSEARILPETQEILDKVLLEIKNEFHIDLHDDLDLYTLLLLHFQPMFQRLKYDLTITNPLLEEIKNNHNQAFEIALLTGKVIEQELHKHVSVEECGYLALHFSLALDRYQEPIQRKNVLIVCASGRGTSQILLNSVKKRFSNKINIIKSISSLKLETEDISDFDMILTTIPLNIKINKPVIQIPCFIKETDYQRIDEVFQYSNESAHQMINECFDRRAFFTNIKGKNQEEVLKNIIYQLKESFDIPSDLYHMLMERENIYSTEYDNGCALPHPIVPIFNRNLIVVSILERPIIWKSKKIKYIFILLFKKDSNNGSEIFNDVLSHLVRNDNILYQLGNNPTYENFTQLLSSITVSANINQDNIFDY